MLYCNQYVFHRTPNYSGRVHTVLTLFTLLTTNQQQSLQHQVTVNLDVIICPRRKNLMSLGFSSVWIFYSVLSILILLNEGTTSSPEAQCCSLWSTNHKSTSKVPNVKGTWLIDSQPSWLLHNTTNTVAAVKQFSTFYYKMTNYFAAWS